METHAPIGMNAETLSLMNEINRVFTQYLFFGHRQIAAYLPRNGSHAGRQLLPGNGFSCKP